MRDEVIALYGDGKSASQIEQETGVKTSTTYYWLSEAGIQRRSQSSRAKKVSASINQDEAMRIAEIDEAELAKITAENPDARTSDSIASLREDQCRWPRGRADSVIVFCSDNRQHGSQYCEAHCALSFSRKLQS